MFHFLSSAFFKVKFSAAVRNGQKKRKLYILGDITQLDIFCLGDGLFMVGQITGTIKVESHMV